MMSDGRLMMSKEIACFSYDDKHEFHQDERSLRYYYPPRLPADLSKGFDTFEQLDDTVDDHLDSLLRTIIDLEQRTGTRCVADIISWYVSIYGILSAQDVAQMSVIYWTVHLLILYVHSGEE